MLSSKQNEVLLRPINPARILTLNGLAHLAAWDVRAHLNRVFGFGGWSADLTGLDLIHDVETLTSKGKEARKVAYRAVMRLTIHDCDATYTEAAVGESVMPTFKHGDAHDMAIKTAESQALKRCATNLGDQFGLSLYNNGSRQSVVVGTLTYTPKDGDETVETDEPDVKTDPDLIAPDPDEV